MLARTRFAAHSQNRQSSRIAKKSLFSSSKNRQQKVLKKGKSKSSSNNSNNAVSYFLRIFVSGIFLLGVFFIVSFFVRSYSQSIDLTQSYTLMITQQKTDDSEESRTIIVSLRGSEKSVNYLLVSESQANLSAYFPIDQKLNTSESLQQFDKQELLAVIAPWNKTTQTHLSFVDRYKIWQYVFAADSAHMQKLTLSNDPTVLLSIIQKYFSDTHLRQLAPTIAIVNTTGQNGVAKQLADILNAWGFTVIQIDSSDQERYEKSLLISEPTDQQGSAVAVSRLKLALPELSTAQDEQVLRQYRTEFVLFVGQDYQAP